MAHDAILEKLRRPFDPGELQAIRELWKAHSIAEDARDIPGLMATLTGDCVYELVQSGHRWEGHAGATAFYTSLLSAFPDIVFDLTDIVIGPQGVIEVADARGTHRGPWLGAEPAGDVLAWQVIIQFPWDPTARLFTGERVWWHPHDARTAVVLGG